MNRKFILVLAALMVFLYIRCGSNTEPGNENTSASEYQPAKSTTDTVVLSMGENSKGIGRFKDIQLTHPLDESMVTKGEAIYQAKCYSCHKLTDEKLVGPGWKGVTDRRTPEWILNFITNTSVMLDSDLVAQAMMATCLVRMPNQSLSDDEAREALEFQRKNDGKN
ncbi:MAG TPA: cytochrome c [Chitinophagales bacterium]|nr:cytochrome c [Chitinophagales bacterium]